MILSPTTPAGSTRYHYREPSTVGHVVIPGLLDSNSVETELPQYLPPQWSTYVHPEGQRYFYRKSDPTSTTDFEVVTEANMYCVETATKVLGTIKEVQDQISSSNVTLPKRAELFLQPAGEESCEYYFADHDLRRLFWLESVSTELLGLSAVASTSHLGEYSALACPRTRVIDKWAELCLTSMYWSHVEYFPMHRSVVDRVFIDEITAVLSHANLDVLTSSTSTFPFSAEKCSAFAKILRNSRDQSSNGNVVWMTARLASLIYEHRISTHYGESTARLGLDQSLFPEPGFEDSSKSRVLSALTFSSSGHYLSQLNSLFVDRTVYVRHWNSFWAQTLKEWKNVCNISVALLLLHVLLRCVNGASLGLTITSAVSLGLSALSSVLLTLQNANREDENISKAYRYLEQARSEKSGFICLASKFALPKASLLWGLFFFTLNWLTILLHYIPVEFGQSPLIVMGAFGLTFLGLFGIRTSWRILRSRRSQIKVDQYSDLV